MKKQEWKPKLAHLMTSEQQEGGEAYTKALIEWLESDCPHLAYDGGSFPKRYCDKCMQELKEGI